MFDKDFLSMVQTSALLRQFFFSSAKKIWFGILKSECHNLCTRQNGGTDMLKRFVIERDIPGIGDFSLTELCAASRASNKALADVGPSIQWQHSYIAGDKTFCIYLAESEAEIQQHSELSGIPVGKITEVHQIIDPLTANN
ncbi:DUF4242 domain-containing protein [Ruegeria atlantica]|uniref:DUF4242 domain-containing protein n=1 Tax=Ruegeria atlantica TaxID=81569 RepID=UPI0034A04583